MRISLLTPHLLAICLTVFLPSVGLSADVSATWLNGTGNWSDPTHWSSNPNYPNNGNGVTYDATINSGGGGTLDRDITIQRLFLNGGGLSGSFDLTLKDGLNLSGGTLIGLTLNLGAGSTSTIAANFASIQGAVIINNSGTVDQNVFFGDYLARPTINNLSGAVWNIHNVGGFLAQLNNSGTVVADHDLGFNSTSLTNSGIITVDGILSVSQSSGGPSISSGTFNADEVRFHDTGYTFTTGATINAGLLGTGETELHITGNTTINADLSLSNSLLLVQAGARLTLTGSLVNDYRGSVHLNGGAFKSLQTLHFEQGRLSGSGTINGNVEHNGTISPGGAQDAFFPDDYVNSPGALVINGNLSLLSDAKLVMEIGGLTAGTQFDKVAVSGLVTFNGTLVLDMINGFQIQLDPTQTFELLTSNGINGAFINVANGERLVTADGLASFKVNYGAGSAFNPNYLILSEPEIVPEPASLVLLTVGAALIGFVQIRRRRVCR